MLRHHPEQVKAILGEVLPVVWSQYSATVGWLVLLVVVAKVHSRRLARSRAAAPADAVETLPAAR